MTTGEVTDLPVAMVGAGPKVRAERIDMAHVKALVEVVDDLPPIVVRRDPTAPDAWVLVDGQHRLSVHRLLVRQTIRAVVVHLDEAEALEAAVTANRSHGKPLSVEERKAAASQLIDLRHDWSNARIARAVGLSDKTVADLRPEGCPTSDAPRLDARTEGGDGRSRPASEMDRKRQRAEIMDAIARDPEASNRTIADRVGCSAMTVISVRREIEDSGTAVPEEPTTPGTGDVEAEAARAQDSEGQAGGDRHPPADPYPDLTYATNAHKAAARLWEDVGLLDGERLASMPQSDKDDWCALAAHLRSKADEIDAAFAAKRHLEAVR